MTGKLYSLLAVVGILLAATHCSSLLGARKICTEKEAQSAEVVAATIESWTKLHQQYQTYAHCDDGAIAEGYSESVTRLLAEKWSHIKKLAAIEESDGSFFDFVIKHIDETAPEERLKRIADNARTRCPRDASGICRAIGDRVELVLSLPQ